MTGRARALAGTGRIPVAGITKNKKPVRVPLASVVIEALAAERRVGGHVFPTVPTLKTWRRALDRAGIELQTPHGRAHRKSIRKTFAARLGEAGVATTSGRA